MSFCSYAFYPSGYFLCMSVFMSVSVCVLLSVYVDHVLVDICYQCNYSLRELCGLVTLEEFCSYWIFVCVCMCVCVCVCMYVCVCV